MDIERAEYERGSHFIVRGVKGRIRDNLSCTPTLFELRRASKEIGRPLERLNIWGARFQCTSCQSEIGGRFGANQNGELLCWNCAIEIGEDTDPRGVTQTTDPTKAVISNSGLHHKNLCNYVINIATGCTHGCKFCYVPSTPNIKMRGDMLEKQVKVKDGQQEWGSYLLYRDDLPERLGRKLDRKRTWEETDDGRGVVMISSGTDCYQDRRAAQITRGCVIELVNHGKPVRILTRSPAVGRDLDVFEAANGLVTVGSSIPCLDEELVRAIEPGAPAPSLRLNALEEISDAGVPVYVAMSPTYPTQNESDLRNLLRDFKERLDPDVVFHEPINPRGANFDMTIQAIREAGLEDKAEEFAKLKDRDHWVEYSVRQLEAVDRIGEELSVPIHLWPDKQLVKYLEGERKEEMREQLERISSPEDYPRGPVSV